MRQAAAEPARDRLSSGLGGIDQGQQRIGRALNDRVRRIGWNERRRDGVRPAVGAGQDQILPHEELHGVVGVQTSSAEHAAVIQPARLDRRPPVWNLRHGAPFEAQEKSRQGC
ncbi:hypothetical protein ACFWYW_53420 [Nonomuraea sp. NPDC059023]|uniref:hypothetical protein n=1 Tax=unclassified Nonomuraea TaxID=2593643 RepID=UPI0036CC502D